MPGNTGATPIPTEKLGAPARRALETAGLKKSFGDTRAVDGIDRRIPRGTVYGFIASD